jgi:hypothetical protein
LLLVSSSVYAALADPN